MTPPIPTGTTYHIYYGVRTSLANMPADALTSIRIRLASEVDDQVEQLLRALHGNNQPYNAPWASTVFDLAASGLDERYRRSSTAASRQYPGFPGAGNPNVAGSGGWYLRNGPGMTGFGRTDVSARAGYASGVGYGIEGLWIADPQDSNAPTQGPAGGRVGGLSSGFVALGTRRYTIADWESLENLGPTFATFYSGEKQIANPTVSAANQASLKQAFRTYLPSGTPVALSGALATIAPPAFFAANILDPNSSASVLQTAIAVGYDLLELAFPDGSVHSFIVDGANGSTINQTQVGLLCLDGSPPAFAAGTTATLAKWVRTRFGIFDGAPELQERRAGAPNRAKLRGTVFMSPPPLTNGSQLGLDIPDPRVSRAARFFAPGATANDLALIWGGYDQAAQTYREGAVLMGDGSCQLRALYATEINTVGIVRFMQPPYRRIQIIEGNARQVDVSMGGTIRIINPGTYGPTRTVHIEFSNVFYDGLSTELFICIERTSSDTYDPKQVLGFVPVVANLTSHMDGNALISWDDPSVGPTTYDLFIGRVVHNQIFWQKIQYKS
ncbi:hypothetical protein [Pendulispora rubella]|uniref:hypothetical protein n=1 Tax=Pendulispora rubella TaxID=2741070 RepID=UPI0030E1A4F3